MKTTTLQPVSQTLKLGLLLSLLFFLGTPLQMTAKTEADNLNSHTKKFLHVQGQVIDQTGAIGHARIMLYEHNEVIRALTTNMDGQFELVIPLQTKCTIRIIREGYYDKFLSFDTEGVPTKSRIAVFEFEAFMWPLKTFNSVKDNGILDFPAGMIYYSEKTDGFTYNRAYAKNIKSGYKALLKEAGDAGELAEELH